MLDGEVGSIPRIREILFAPLRLTIDAVGPRGTTASLTTSGLPALPRLTARSCLPSARLTRLLASRSRAFALLSCTLLSLALAAGALALLSCTLAAFALALLSLTLLPLALAAGALALLPLTLAAVALPLLSLTLAAFALTLLTCRAQRLFARGARLTTLSRLAAALW